MWHWQNDSRTLAAGVPNRRRQWKKTWPMSISVKVKVKVKLHILYRALQSTPSFVGCL
jgi:hypothetical protein